AEQLPGGRDGLVAVRQLLNRSGADAWHLLHRTTAKAQSATCRSPRHNHTTTTSQQQAKRQRYLAQIASNWAAEEGGERIWAHLRALRVVAFCLRNSSAKTAKNEEKKGLGGAQSVFECVVRSCETHHCVTCEEALAVAKCVL